MTAPTPLSSYTGNVAGSLNPTVASVNVPGGTVDPMIIVSFNAANNAAFNAATWNGESFTLMASNPSSWFDKSAWLIPTTTGSHTLTLTVPFFGNNGIISVTVFSGAKAVSKDADIVSSEPFDTFASATITTTQNDSLVFDYGVLTNPFFSGAAPTVTQGAGQTLLTTNNSGVSWMRQTTSYKTVATAGTPTTMTITSSMGTSQQGIEVFEIMSVLPVAPFAPSVIII